VLLWFAAGESRLLPLRPTLADPANRVSISIVSIWEAAVKVRVRKLKIDPLELLGEALAARFALLDVLPEHIGQLLHLPIHRGHGDPFDQLLLAQAAAEGATLVSADAKMRDYGVDIMPVP
jgi:PIN domain nuclease of toxin-antitoxin system